MKRLSTRPAAAEDVEYVIANLRPGDRMELIAIGDASAADLVRVSFAKALFCEVVLLDGVPAALYGLGTGIGGEHGCPWMVGTELADTFSASFVRKCRPMKSRMLGERASLVNLVHTKNKKAQRWLRWLGFHMEAPITIRATGERFLPFWAARRGSQATAEAGVGLIRSALGSPPTESLLITNSGVVAMPDWWGRAEALADMG